MPLPVLEEAVNPRLVLDGSETIQRILEGNEADLVADLLTEVSRKGKARLGVQRMLSGAEVHVPLPPCKLRERSFSRMRLLIVRTKSTLRNTYLHFVTPKWQICRPNGFEQNRNAKML